MRKRISYKKFDYFYFHILIFTILIYKKILFAVYMPAKRELQSGLMDHPVTCTTLERLHTSIVLTHKPSCYMYNLR